MSRVELEQHLRDNLALSSAPRGEDWATAIQDDVRRLKAEKEKNELYRRILDAMPTGKLIYPKQSAMNPDE
jgi:hypothetical protein